MGAGQVIKGLDEGLLSMQPGGIRRLYIPGNMAFPKGLKAAPGRCVRAWVIHIVPSLQRVWGLCTVSLLKCLHCAQRLIGHAQIVDQLLLNNWTAVHHFRASLDRPCVCC